MDLTTEEIKERRLKLGLTQEQAAVVFGAGGLRTWHRWEREEGAMPRTAELLLLACEKIPWLVQWLHLQADKKGNE